MASADEKQLPRGVRGYAVLITNEEFLGNLPESEDPTRKGADKDDMNLQYIFNTKLGFQLLDKMNYKNTYKTLSTTNVSKHHWIHDSCSQNTRCVGHDSLQQNERCPCPCITCKIQTTDHSNSECFVLAISTHGVKVRGKQEVLFSDETVKLSDIIETLNDENCKTLKGKPRIILLQLCRSDPDVPKNKQDDVWHDEGHVASEEDLVERRLQKLAVEESKTGDTVATNTDTGEPQDMEDTEVVRLNQGVETCARKTDVKGNVEAEKDDTFATDVNKDTVTMTKSSVEAENDDTNAGQEYFYGTEEALRKLPSEFLIIFPTVTGKKTWRSVEHGSWLIQELREVVENFMTPDMNFLTVLTKTAENVALKKESKEGYKCAVCIVHRLLRPIIFRDIRDTSQKQPSLTADRPAL